MTAGPVSQRVSGHSALAQWAVGLAGAGAVLVAVALVGLGFGGIGVVVSFAAFALAVMARLRHDRWVLLWLPLLLFPVLVVTAPLWV